MPNQPAAGKKVTTVLLHEELLARLQKIADREDRSRNKIIEMLLDEQADKCLRENEKVKAKPRKK
jgi:predicted transcriptional regulator